MTIKSILVHLANDADHGARLQVAYGLACRHQAGITALYTATPIGMPAAIAGRGASSAYIAEAIEIAREKAALVEADFRDWSARNALPCRWIVEEGDPLELLSRQSYYADLAVVSQTDTGNLEEMLFNQLPDHLAMTGSCPTLVLPQGHDGQVPGRRALVAWKPGRESSRAVRDALPLLRAADQVTVLTVDASEHEAASAAPLAAWLGLHDIQAQIETCASHDGIAQTLQDYATRHRYDLIVMGAYGHSRLRELVLGGATRDMLGGASVPLLMSH